MSKRTFVDPVTNVTHSVDTGNQVGSAIGSKKYFKSNYVKVLELITPGFYKQEDLDLSGTELSELSQLTNSHLLALRYIADILPVSSIAGDLTLSSFTSPEAGAASVQTPGISRYFSKQNNLTRVTSYSFERDILRPRGTRYTNYDSSAEFLGFVSGTLLTELSCPLPDSSAGGDNANLHNLAYATVSAYDDTSEGTHKHLTNSMSWLYFLNRRDPCNFTDVDYSTSNEVAKLITKNLYFGESIELTDCMKVMETYLWRNYGTIPRTDLTSFSSINTDLIPESYVSAGDSSGLTYASGTQHLDKLKTLIDILYSPYFSDAQDTTVKDAIQEYLDTSTISDGGDLLTLEESKGPFHKFLKALSFSFADRNAEAEELSTLIDIERIPEDLLQFLAELIGWKLIGDDPQRWRLQLRSAIDIYKAKGTKKAIQLYSNSLFGAGVFDVTATNINELWESYIPNLIYYSLVTDSSYFTEGFKGYTNVSSDALGVRRYSPDSMETNIKLCVDKIIGELFTEFPTHFRMANKQFPIPTFKDGTGSNWTGSWHKRKEGFWTGIEPFSNSVPLKWDQDPDFTFHYRGSDYHYPNWEEEKYYQGCQLSPAFVNTVRKKLICFGVTPAFATKVANFINENSSERIDINSISNNWLLFTPSSVVAPNHDSVIKNPTKRVPNPLDYLSLWNGKSSHFKMVFESESFNFTKTQFASDSRYAIQSVIRFLEQVIPAHAIADVYLDVSSVDDSTSGVFMTKTCPTISFKYSASDGDYKVTREPQGADAAVLGVSGGGGHTSLINYGTCAANMHALGIHFTRESVNSTYDSYLSTSNYTATVPRNSLRRRSFKHVLPTQDLFMRDGKTTPGNISLSSPFYLSGIGFHPLGFIPSALNFNSVQTKRDPQTNLGDLIDTSAFPGVWEICENFSSSNTFDGVATANTYAFRGASSIAPSECFDFLGREKLHPILMLMHRVKRYEKLLEASSIVSGYFSPNGSINGDWPSSSAKLTPNDLSSWYKFDHLNVVESMTNQLDNANISSTSISDFIHFRFGEKINRFYNDWLSVYKQGHLSLNNLGYGYFSNPRPNILSHIYGPYFFNNNFAIDGSAITTSANLITSSFGSEMDISWGGGQGLLSNRGRDWDDYRTDIGSVSAVNPSDLYVNNYEWRNDCIVSSVDLVDTSAGSDTKPGSTGPLVGMFSKPTFSLIRLDRDEDSGMNDGVSDWLDNRFMVDNLVIKYRRPEHIDRFARMRFKIKPDRSSDARIDSNPNYAKNFLNPEHWFDFKLKALNMHDDGVLLGGQTLGVWIHTKPQKRRRRLDDGSYISEDTVWSYTPRGVWEGTPVSSITTAGMGVNMVKTLSHPYTFGVSSLASQGAVTTTSIGREGECPVVVEPSIPIINPRHGCGIGGPPESKVNSLMFDNISISFNTINLDETKLHSVDQEYYFEVFAFNTDYSKFFLIDSVRLEDSTMRKSSVIQTDLADYNLKPSELKTIFNFYNDLRNGEAGRDAFSTSGLMDVSGGSRQSYRDNALPFGNSLTRNANTGGIATLEILEG